MTKKQRNLIAKLLEIGGSELTITLNSCRRPVDADLKKWRELFVGYCNDEQLGPARRCALAIAMSPEIADLAGADGQDEHYPRRLNALIAWFASCSDGLTGRGWSLLKDESGPEELLSRIHGKSDSFPAAIWPRKRELTRRHAYRVVWRPTDVLEFVSSNRARHSGLVVDTAGWPANYPMGMLARLVSTGGVIVLHRCAGQEQNRMLDQINECLKWVETSLSVSCEYKWARTKLESEIRLLSATAYHGSDEDIENRMKMVGEHCLIWTNGKKVSNAIVGVLEKMRVDKTPSIEGSVFGCITGRCPQITSEIEAWTSLFRFQFSRRQHVVLISGDESLLLKQFEAARCADLRVFVGRLVGAAHGRLRVVAPSFVDGIPSSLDRCSPQTRARRRKQLEFIESLNEGGTKA